MTPKLLTRYVLWELAKTFSVASLGFVSLMIVFGVGQETVKHGLGPDIAVRLAPYLIPKALMFAMPATCLFSICVVFGRLAADNELVAIESLGLPKTILIAPALIMAFLLSLFAVWINDISFAWSYWGVQRIVMESSDRIVYGVLKNEGSFHAENFSIEVDGIKDHRLIHPVITIKNSKRNDARIVAQEAYLTSNPNRHSLNLTITKGLIEVEGKASMQFDDTVTHEIPLKTPEEIAYATGNPSHLYLSQIVRAIDAQESELERIQKENALQCCSQMLGGDLVSLTSAEWTSQQQLEQNAGMRLNRLYVVPHRRWANGFSCFAFAVIGIPVAIRMKTSNYATTFGVCFLPILLTYYPLFMFGLNGAKLGTLPPQAAWLGDIACTAIGGLLLLREFRK